MLQYLFIYTNGKCPFINPRSNLLSYKKIVNILTTGNSKKMFDSNKY